MVKSYQSRRSGVRILGRMTMNRESEKFLASGEGMIKFFRRMFETGVSLGQLMKVVNHDDQLARAAAYIKADCPEIEFVDGKQVVTSASDETETNQFITVKPDLAFKVRIERGKYSGTSYHLLMEKKFPVTANQVGEWEWKLFHFNLNISSWDAIRLMRDEGFEPGAIGHILAFGEASLEGQRKYYPIIGLGSIARIYFLLRVPELWFNLDLRHLKFASYRDRWRPNCRFLGVRRCAAFSGH